MKAKASAGGAATAGGMDFQHSVAAWVAALILAEKVASPPWELPVTTTLDWLQCETDQPTDDLLVGASNDGLIFAQIKRTLELSKGTKADFASALDQFVRQFLASRSKLTGIQPLNRPLDPKKDRFVLITTPTSSKSIRLRLNRVLDRIRDLSQYQTVDNATRNIEEKKVLPVVKAHIARSWQNVSGTDPSDDEFRQILSLIHVHVLDLDEGGTDVREAKNLLRSAVLSDPEKADLAWSKLVDLCAGLAVLRSGIDRKHLQEELLNSGIELQAARSYRTDIERLKEHSKQISDSLAYLARIRVGSIEIKIRRPCTETLKLAAEENSILVVGEPGAGKSGALHDFVDVLREEARDYVFLAVDHLESQSLGLLREEIGLNYELLDVLDNWSGSKSAFLVIDALDAARGDLSAAMIRNLIRLVIEKNKRWHVVASIRKFDLRYSEEIKQLFLGEPLPEFQDNEFSHIHHLNVPYFSKKEVGQISSQSPELFAILGSAPQELYDLLSVPFNLQLAAELLGIGDTRSELLPIRTQLGLLERYWLRRVIGSNTDGLGDAHEAVLREVCEKMVAERALRVHRSIVARPDTGALLQNLLSTQVLIEWQPSPETPPDRYILAFAHHVLFDYAVARLLLRGDPEDVVQRLVNDPELLIVIRPSILLHFRYIWGANIKQFWDLVFRFNQAAGMPEIGKLIGPSVATELARQLNELDPLFSALDNHHMVNQNTAEQVLKHLMGALLASAPCDARLFGPNSGPWCELLERVSRSHLSPVVYTVQSLLNTICDRPEYLTPKQLVAAGQTSRQILEFAWSQIPRDGRLIINALRCVCRTFESNPTSSAALIRRCLEPLHLSQFGFEEVPWLADEVVRLIPLDSGLVEEIYRKAFSHRETSTESTQIGQSRILSLSSNRRQDYEMALYKLAEVFPQFLERTPERATHALIVVMEAYGDQHHPPASGEWHEEIFEFGGSQACLRTDYSANWDRNFYREGAPLQMLDTFQRYLEELAEKHERMEELRVLVHIIISENRNAVIWHRLLLAGSRFPSTLGMEILPLCWAMPVLIGFDTSYSAGEYLKVIFPTLHQVERARIERAILKIPENVSEDHLMVGERVRNRLLGCLASESIVTSEARSLLDELQTKNAILSNEPAVRIGGQMDVPYSEEDYLADMGVPVEGEANKKIREFERPVKAFVDDHQNSDPTLAEIRDVLPAIRELHDAFSSADADGVHPKQRDHSWGYIAAACSLIPKNEQLSNDDELCALIRRVLLEASHNPEPAQNPEYEAQFDEHPSWGLQVPRIEAAKGLIMLARLPTCAGSKVLEAIENLSKDPVPSVRFQIAACANFLYKTAQGLMWQIIECMCRDEPNRGVLQGLLGGPLNVLSRFEPDRVAVLTKAIFDRVMEGPGANEVRGLCVDIFSSLYIWRGHILCGEIAREIVASPVTYPNEAHNVLMKLRDPLTHGSTNRPDPEVDAVRRRAFDLLAGLLVSAHEGLRQLEVQHNGVQSNEWPQDDQDKAKSILSLIGSVSSEVYFASGAYDRKRQGLPGPSLVMKPESKRFYKEAGLIIDELTNVGIPSVAHYLLQTLEFFVKIEPHDVFLRIGRVISAGQQWGYQYESQAADLIVKLIERYLAEYRSLLKEDEECRRTLVELLDVFVQAGWPSARRLTYRLEEIYR